MGQCYGRTLTEEEGCPRRGRKGKVELKNVTFYHHNGATPNHRASSNNYSYPTSSPLPPFSPLAYIFSPQPSMSPFFHLPTNASLASPAQSKLRKFIKRPFPLPSPAKHIQSALAKRHGLPRPKEEAISEVLEVERTLSISFGYNRSFNAKYELGLEVGHGHFGHTCIAKAKKGIMKGQSVAVKIISKAKMTTSIAIEDVRREVKILKALSGHRNLVRFYDACEDEQNVYIVMELCEGGELLENIIKRGGRYSEEDAKTIIIQILCAVSFFHLQGVVHRDLKPENFLFATKDESASLKAIDFGLSDFVRPDERLSDVVGSAYYVAPEVLQRSYAMEADIWSIGVIVYILLCGSRPFWARTESGIFRAVLKLDPSFDEPPWTSISSDAKKFVKCLLNRDMRKRMTTSQALAHPWLRGDHKIPLDIFVYRMVNAYLRSSSLRKKALKALARMLSEDELYYLRAQYVLLQPNKDGWITSNNFRAALMRNATQAMKEARMFDMLKSMDGLAFKKMDFQEFCAAAMSIHQLENLEHWEDYARTAYVFFNKDGNRVVGVDELAREFHLASNVPPQIVFHDCIRHNDGMLSYTGFRKLLHGISSRPHSRKN